MPTNQTQQGNIAVPNRLSNRPRTMRLYQDDDNSLVELHRLVKNVAPVDIVDLIRDCIKAGRPIIESRWGPLAKEAKKELANKNNEPDR